MAQESILRIVIDSRNAERNAQALDRELRSIQRNGEFASRSMDGFSVACRQLAGYMMGVVTAGAAIAKMDDWTGLNNRLRLVTNSQQELNKAMQDTFDIAQRSGAAWGGTAAIYQKIQYNSEKLGLSQEKVAKITESISKSISNSGSSAQAASAALYQLGQSFDKSSLNGDEFVSMSENAGYLMEVFAKGLGVTRAELKEMSTAGELTTDKMIQAISKMSKSIEEDFGKTNYTIGQGIQVLSNAVTKFIGDSDQTIGASKGIHDALRDLSENLDTVAQVAMVGGAYWLGTYIPALYKTVVAGYAKAKQLSEQTLTQWAAINAEKAAAAQEVLSAEAKLVNLQATRAQIVEELKLELRRMKNQISAQGTINSELRMGLLRQQQAAINAELTATETALAAARTRSTAAAAASMGIVSKLLGVFGGPVGLGLTVAGVAASYLLLRDNTKSSTTSLRENNESVDEAIVKYRELKEAKQKSQLVDEKNKLKELADSYNNATDTLTTNAYALTRHNDVTSKQAKELNALIAEFKKSGDIDQFSKSINNLSFINQESKDKFNKLAGTVSDANSKYKDQKSLIDEINKLTPNAVKAIDERTAAHDRERKAVEAANKAYTEYSKDALADIKEMAAKAKMQKMGLSENQIQERLKVLKLLDYDPVKAHSQSGIEMKKLADISAKMKDAEDAKTKAIKEQNKELKNQEKTTERLVGLVGSTGGSTGNHLDIRYDRSYSNGAISAEHMARFQLGGKTLDPRNSNSPYGMRTHPITGKQQLHRGYDFRAPEGTQVTTNFAVKNVETFYDKKGGGYTSRVTFEDGVIVNLLHQIPEMKSKIKGGASKGHSASSNEAYEAFEAQQRNLQQLQLEQYQSREQIAYEFADRTIKIEKDLENQILEIQKANFSPEDTKAYIEAAKNRAELEKEIFVSQIEFQVNEFQLSEEDKLKARHRINKLMLQADRDVSDANKEIQDTFLEKQHQKELALIRFAREEREFQMRLQFISETQAMEERYELEEKKLIEVNDLQERNFKREMLRLQKQEEVKNRSDNALKNWGNIQSEIYGTSEMDQLDHTRNDRYKASEELFNSNMSSIDQQEQDPTADLFEIAALREKAWQEHHDRMKLIDQEYWSSSRALQFSMASNMFGTLTNMLKESGAERTGIYRGMLAVEKGFAIASAAVQIPDAMSKALNAPFPANIAAMGTVATLGASIVSSIHSVAAGFATGGHVRGPGTSTSDSIPAMLSDYEFVTKASAVKKIGVANMEYMNRTGEMPFQREYEELHKRIAGNQLPEPFIVPKYKDGGLVGSSRVRPDSYSQIYREREVVNKVNAVNVQPKITINTPPGTYTETQVDTDGAITIDVIRKEAEDAAKRSWDRLGNANSHESQQLSRNTNSNRRR